MEDYGDSSHVSVTIKIPESGKFAGDNPWLVFKGASAETVKQKIAEAFGLEHEGLLLIDVTVNAEKVAKGLTNVIAGLGGRVLKSTPTDDAPRKGSFEEARSGDVWSQVEQTSEKPAAAPKEEAKDPVLAAIEAAASVDELKKIWAQNQKAFTAKPDLMAAWKAKGKSLS